VTPGHTYWAYGLSIRSDLPLPELEPTDADGEVAIRISRGSVRPRPRRPALRTVRGDLFVSHPTVGTLRCHGGTEITVHPVPNVDEAALVHYILVNGIAAMLYQRGFLVLHASAVKIKGRAVAFLARSGSGKSTMAAALAARGHELIVDDVLAITTRNGAPAVHRGAARLKLTPDSLAQLGEDAEKLPRVWPHDDKRAHQVATVASRSPVRLGWAYTLAEGEAIEVVELPRQERLQVLVQNTFTARLLRSGGAEAHFRQCVDLSASLPIRRLSRPMRLEQLPEVAAAVEADLAG
jgi:hypothetical protein